MELIYKFNKSKYANLCKSLTITVDSKGYSPECAIAINLATKDKLLKDINHSIRLSSWLEHYKYVSMLVDLIENLKGDEVIKMLSVIDCNGLILVVNSNVIKILYQHANIKAPLLGLEFNDTNTPGLLKEVYNQLYEVYVKIRETNITSIEEAIKHNKRSGNENNPFILTVLAEGYNREIDESLFVYNTSHDKYDLYTTDKFIKIEIGNSNNSIIIRNDPYSIIRLVKFCSITYGLCPKDKIKLSQTYISTKHLNSNDNLRLDLADRKLEEFDEFDNSFITIDSTFIAAIHAFKSYLLNKYR